MPATAFSSVSPFRSNKKIAEHQEYVESGYPIILNVRLFGNSYRFRGSVQSSVIQLSAQSILILNFLNLTLPFFNKVNLIDILRFNSANTYSKPIDFITKFMYNFVIG